MLATKSTPDISVKPGIFSTFGDLAILPPKPFLSISATVLLARAA